MSPDLCCDIWTRLDAHNFIVGAQYKHLLWALYFRKVYGKEEDNANYSGVDERMQKIKKTYVWLVDLTRVSEDKSVKFSQRDKLTVDYDDEDDVD